MQQKTAAAVSDLASLLPTVCSPNDCMSPLSSSSNFASVEDQMLSQASIELMLDHFGAVQEPGTTSVFSHYQNSILHIPLKQKRHNVIKLSRLLQNLCLVCQIWPLIS